MFLIVLPIASIFGLVGVVVRAIAVPIEILELALVAIAIAVG